MDVRCEKCLIWKLSTYITDRGGNMYVIRLIYSHGQELFYKFISNFTNKLVKQLLSMTVNFINSIILAKKTCSAGQKTDGCLKWARNTHWDRCIESQIRTDAQMGHTDGHKHIYYLVGKRIWCSIINFFVYEWNLIKNVHKH